MESVLKVSYFICFVILGVGVRISFFGANPTACHIALVLVVGILHQRLISGSDSQKCLVIIDLEPYSMRHSPD